MPVKLLKEASSGIHVSLMEDGDIAIITQWGTSSEHVGTVVQKHKSDLIALGKTQGYSWSNLFTEIVEAECRVRILPKGTTFILE
jgi:hypothetical protein